MMTSNKPYFIRAVYEWVVDNDFTPYLLVNAEHPNVEVPQEYVNGGRIILNISPRACRGLHLDNDKIVFTAKFSGQTFQSYVDPDAVLAIYAKENGRGMEFGPEYDAPAASPVTHKKNNIQTPLSAKRPVLTLVKNDKSEDEEE